MTTHSTALSVNLNKVALVRNTRHLGIPSVTRAATLCLQAGASGITVHPRPDARHIRPDDVLELAYLMKAWPDKEFNIEGNPLHNLMDCVADLIARKLPVHQVTFVPDGEGQFTSDHGWNFPQDANRLRPLIAQVHAWGLRVSLFMDATPDAMAQAKAIGADRVELYTEPYARAAGSPAMQASLGIYAASSRAAMSAGLEVNAGHDLNRDNLPTFIAEVPGIAEVSIGHALIADALEFGLDRTVRLYLQALGQSSRNAAVDPS